MEHGKKYTPSEFAAMLRDLGDNGFEQWAPHACESLGKNVYDRAVSSTHVRTGLLRRSYNMSMSHESGKGGGRWVCTIKNPVYYASYVEYGHRTANHRGWVPGQFMLQKAVERVNEHQVDILTADLISFLRRWIG